MYFAVTHICILTDVKPLSDDPNNLDKQCFTTTDSKQQSTLKATERYVVPPSVPKSRPWPPNVTSKHWRTKHRHIGAKRSVLLPSKYAGRGSALDPAGVTHDSPQTPQLARRGTPTHSTASAPRFSRIQCSPLVPRLGDIAPKYSSLERRLTIFLLLLLVSKLCSLRMLQLFNDYLLIYHIHRPTQGLQ